MEKYQDPKRGFFKYLKRNKAIDPQVRAEEVTKPASDEDIVVEPTKEVLKKPVTKEVMLDTRWIWNDFEDSLFIKTDPQKLVDESDLFVCEMEALLNRTIEEAIKRASEEPEAGSEPNKFSARLEKTIFTKVSKDGMAAWIYVFPSEEGEDVTLEKLQKVLTENRITYGILDGNLQAAAKEKIYKKAVLIARGLPSRNGVDGYVTERFKREVLNDFIEDERGVIDFKNLNNIQAVKANDVICDIVLSIPGVKGKTVLGAEVSVKHMGKNAPIRCGRNTKISSDGLALIAQKAGHVVFKNQVFNVETALRIPGDIDGTTGNINYDGNVFIAGDVRNGFSVTATGDVQVQGSVEGAEINAGGNILVARGVSGNRRAKLICEGSLKSKYLEHCTAIAKGNIIAESIVRSEVQSNQQVLVINGVGAIIGGRIMASQWIEAKAIGSKARLQTTLVLGNIPQIMEDIAGLKDSLKKNRDYIREVDKNIRYLESGKHSDKLHLLDKLKEAKAALLESVAKSEVQLEELDKTVTDLKTCRIKCKSLYPVTFIQFGSSILTVKEEYSLCNIFCNDKGEIVIGAG